MYKKERNNGKTNRLKEVYCSPALKWKILTENRKRTEKEQSKKLIQAKNLKSCIPNHWKQMVEIAVSLFCPTPLPFFQ